MKFILFRFAEKEDCDDLFMWRNDPATVKISPSGKVEYHQHVQWFNQKLQNQNTHIFIILNQELVKIGMIRFDRKNDNAEISINITPLFRSQGYGKESLKKVLHTYFSNFPVSTIHARIYPQNKASQYIFKLTGFHIKKNEPPKKDGTILTEITREQFFSNDK